MTTMTVKYYQQHVWHGKEHLLHTKFQNRQWHIRDSELALGIGQRGPCQGPAPCGGPAWPFWAKSHRQKQVKFERSHSHFDSI